MIQQGVLWAIVAFVAGLVWHAGRTFERLATMQRELGKLETELKEKLGRIEAVLYTTVGGRRKVLPIEQAGDVERDPHA